MGRLESAYGRGSTLRLRTKRGSLIHHFSVAYLVFACIAGAAILSLHIHADKAVVSLGQSGVGVLLVICLGSGTAAVASVWLVRRHFVTVDLDAGTLASPMRSCPPGSKLVSADATRYGLHYLIVLQVSGSNGVLRRLTVVAKPREWRHIQSHRQRAQGNSPHALAHPPSPR